MDAADIADDLAHVLLTSQQVSDRVADLAAQIDADYAGRELLMVGVLNGAMMVMSDLTRAMKSHCYIDWMAISSYGSGTQSSGVVRILKDLTTDITGRDVMIVEDIIDTGLTLSYLMVMTMFRKPDAITSAVDVRYVGFDIPTEFVVGYGLDFDGRYRNLKDVATLAPHVYS